MNAISISLGVLIVAILVVVGIFLDASRLWNRPKRKKLTMKELELAAAQDVFRRERELEALLEMREETPAEQRQWPLHQECAYHGCQRSGVESQPASPSAPPDDALLQTIAKIVRDPRGMNVSPVLPGQGAYQTAEKILAAIKEKGK